VHTKPSGSIDIVLAVVQEKSFRRRDTQTFQAVQENTRCRFGLAEVAGVTRVVKFRQPSAETLQMGAQRDRHVRDYRGTHTGATELRGPTHHDWIRMRPTQVVELGQAFEFGIGEASRKRARDPFPIRLRSNRGLIKSRTIPPVEFLEQGHWRTQNAGHCLDSIAILR
jgi:hypothetical protein